MRSRRNFQVFFLCVLAWGCFNLFWQNGAIALWDQDEAAYAGFAHQILATGDWITPDFLWSDPHRKTPFHFWAIALAFQHWGATEFAVRFPSACAVLLTGFSIYAKGKSILGEKVARLATIIVFSSLFLPNFGKVSLTDSLLVAFETLAMLALWHSLQHPRWRWTLLFWTTVSLGVLTKGPPILILTLGAIATLALFSPQRRHLIALHPWFGLPLALAPLILWGRLAWLADGGVYIRWMIDWYILKRATGGTTFGQWGPPGYYLLVFIVGFLPWLAFFPPAFLHLFRNLWSQRSNPFYAMIAVWLLWGWWVYELIPSKLPSYAMGAYGAIAILLAHTIVHWSEIPENNTLKWGMGLFLTFALLLSVGLIGASQWLFDSPGVVVTSLVSLLWAGWAIATVQQLGVGRLNSAIVLTTANGLLLTFLVWGFIMPILNLNHSATQRVAQYIAQTTTPQSQVIFADYFDLPSLPFYLAQSQRTYIGLEKNPLPLLQQYYQSERETVLIFNQSEPLQGFLQQLKQANLPDPQLVNLQGWFSQMGTIQTYTLVYQGRGEEAGR